MYEGANWTGLTTENHLGRLYLEKPQKASMLATKIYNTNFGMDLDSYLSQFPTKKFDTDADFTWELIGSAKKNVKLVEARIDGTPITSTDTPGKYNQEFELVFDEKHFTDVNVIVGHKNEVYPLQILDEPEAEGSRWVYRVRLLSGDDSAFMPYEELVQGTRFSREYSVVEHSMSIKGGEIAFTAPLTMRNAFSMIRLQHTTPGNMINRPMATAFKAEDGSVHQVWTQYEDYMFEHYFRMEKNNLLMFGKSNKAEDGTYKQKGKSGNKLKIGSGIREQMETSNTYFYNNFNIDMLTNILMDLSEGRLPTDKRKFVLRTGERGAYQFHKALENYTQLYTPNRDANRIYNVNSAISNMGKGYGGQFIEYIGPNGIEVALSIDSLYDDKVRFKEYHPDGGVTESYRYDILDVGTTDGEPNIQKCEVKGYEDIMGYQPGLRDPFSPTGQRSRIMTTPEDSYTQHRACYVSAIVRDPSKTASLIYNG